MRIEKDTEVTIKVRIGYVWPDDFEDKYHISEESFRNTEQIPDPETARDLLMNMYENSADLLQFATITVQDMGIVRE